MTDRLVLTTVKSPRWRVWLRRLLAGSMIVPEYDQVTILYRWGKRPKVISRRPAW